MTFGERLKEARESRALSQSALADMVCVTQQSIAAYEKGIRKPTLEILSAICDALTCSADHLLGRK